MPSILFCISLFFLLALLPTPLLSATFTTAKSHHYRRILHQPLFPLDQSLPPTPLSTPEPRLSSPSPQPQQQRQPKYPFSSQGPPTTETQPHNTFFPLYPSPPPPSASALATFPANISSLSLPQSSSPSKPISRKLVAVIVSVSLFSAALIAAIAAFLLHHKQKHHQRLPHYQKEHSLRTDSLRLFPPDTTPSDAATTTAKPTISNKPPPQPAPTLRHHSATSTSSEFLYLGTLVSTRELNDKSSTTPDDQNSASYGRLNSPELRPLPPLPRHNLKQDTRNADLASSDEEGEEEEFFSPRGSSGDQKDIPSPYHTGSSSSQNYKAALDRLDAEKTDHNFRSKSTNSYLYSNSNSPTHSSSSSPSVILNLGSPISLTSKSPDSLVNFPAPPRYIPPPAPPLRPFRPLSPPSSSEGTQNSPTRPSDFSSQNFESPVSKSSILPPPRPPPPPPGRVWERPGVGPPELVVPSRPVVGRNLSGERKAEESTLMKPKLKPLHWDKVRASSDRTMVWDQLKASSFQLNEEMIETLFTVNSSNVNLKNGNQKLTAPGSDQENWVLDPKKSQNIAILLKALNVTTEEVCEGLLEGNADTLGTELLESLMKMAPTKEEEQKLLEFKDDSPSKVGPAEKFLKAVLEIPFAFKRIDAMLYITNFESEVEYLKSSFGTLEVACTELKNSRMFMKLLEAVLKTGNRMNVGTNRGDAQAFKLDTLLKLVDVKGTDGKTTLLHFVVHEIIRAEGSRISGADQIPNGEKNQQSTLRDELELNKIGLQVVSRLGGELSNVKKAASMDADVLSSEVVELVNGVTKITEVMKLNEELGVEEESHRKFSLSMNEFLKKAKEEIINIQVQEGLALSMVKEVTEYFHGDSAKEEAHPFRIFMVVRDFLSSLDQVCRDVGKINERTIVSSGRQIPVSVNPPSLAPVFPGLDMSKEHSSSDDDSSSSSYSS